mmetsp:Transcript_49204/g.137834  ORF Transcript_49204/g.137834 Transcript_49204/m.137834 type:complete len:244 (-) Transcript_49204:243-974(-)
MVPNKIAFEQALGHVPSERDHALLASAAEKDREGTFETRHRFKSARVRENVKDVEILGLRKASQTESKHAVKFKAAERILGHLRSSDHLDSGTPMNRGSLDIVFDETKSIVGYLLEGRRLHLQKGRTRSFFSVGFSDAFSIAKAHLVTHEDASDFPRAVGHSDLVTRHPKQNLQAIGVDVNGCHGRLSIVALVLDASRRFAPRGRKYEVAAARVEDDVHDLRRGRADGDPPMVRALVLDDTAA